VAALNRYYPAQVSNADLSPRTKLGCQLKFVDIFLIGLFLNLVKHTSKIFKNSKDSKYVLIFSLALVVVEFFSNFVIFY
jgi:hypothetical protein